MNTITVRKIRPEDYSSVSQIMVSALLPYWQEKQLSNETIHKLTNKYNENYIRNKVADNPFYVAEDTQNNKVVGTVGLRKSDRQSYERLSTFFVDPLYQHQGIGRLLFEAIKKEALQRKAEVLLVSSTPIAKVIYEHLGFKKVGVDVKKHENGVEYYNIWMELKPIE